MGISVLLSKWRDSMPFAKRQVDKAPLEVQGAVSRASPVGCSSKTKAGEGVMSKGVRFSHDYCEFDRTK